MTNIKYSPSSIALGLNIKHFFTIRERVSASQVITWICPKINKVPDPDIKSPLERMIQPIAHEILYKAYLHERETYIKKELENPSFVMVKESEEGRLYQVLPTEEELRSRFRPYRFDLSLALLEQLDVSYFLYSKKEEILPLIGLEIYSSVLNSIWDIKHLQANEFFKRLINKEASPKKIAESVYRVFREKFPDQEIETVQYMCSWGAVDKDLSWLQALPIFQSWREKILFERENKT